MSAKIAGAEPRVVAHDRLYDRLRDALIFGEVEAGQKISVRLVAASFGVSVTPARDALNRLVWERGLDQLPGGSLRVPVLDLAEIEQLREQSKLFELLALEKAIPNLADRDIEALDRLHAESWALLFSGDILGGRRRLREARFKLFAHAECDWLLRLIEQVWLRRGPSAAAHYLAFARGAMEAGVTPDPPLNQAVRRRDIAGAKAALAEAMDRFFDDWAGAARAGARPPQIDRRLLLRFSDRPARQEVSDQE